MIFYECSECLRAYTEPGPATFCHPDTIVTPIDQDVVDSAMKHRASTERTAWGDKVLTYKTGAKRANSKKIRWDLMPLAPMRDTALIWTFGAEKYGDRNWEQGFDWSGPYASLQRHLQAWFAGEDFDPESGMSHLAHAACNLQMLQQFEYTYKEGDDRPLNTCPPVRKANVKKQENKPTEDTNSQKGHTGSRPTRW